MSKFHNPYHFVPVKKRDEAARSRDLEVESARSGKWNNHGHDSFGEKLYSGRLTCLLETKTPVFIGGRQHEGTLPKQIDHYEIDGEPAIPGTSLRGLISSIAESASNSAMRVLHREQPLSYRYAMKNNMSAIGMVETKTADDGRTTYLLKPLVMPSLDKQYNGEYLYPKNFAGRPCSYAPVFSNFKQPPLKVFVNRGDKKTFCIDTPQYYYLKLDKSIQFNGARSGVKASSSLRFSSKDVDFRTAIGQKGEMNPLTQAQWDALSEQERSLYTRGIVRVMGSARERSDIPFGKKHEHFIPYPPELEQATERIIIPENVVDRFHSLSDQRTDENAAHPYEPIGTVRNTDEKLGNKLRLKHGDIVFFAPNSDGTEVAEISFSSIWRGSAGTVEDYFNKVDPELLPFSKTRTRITPAELLFGFVQDDKDKNGKALAFKGKVRVSSARLIKDQQKPYQDSAVTLKILSSPKLPSPALYFKPAGNPAGGYIQKSALKPENHQPQGRKMYLHHIVKSGERPWETGLKDKYLNQKNSIKPLRKDLLFEFHLDFDNLSEWELGLLCFAVRPMEDFRHKIGMGKSIGLGTVCIDLEKLELVDRSKRYSAEGFLSGRHVSESMSPDQFRKFFAESMDPDIKNALRLLGAPKFIKAPVHTPQVDGEPLEKDTFKWFVANDKLNRGQEFLQPLKNGMDTLPTLDTPLQPDNGGGNRQRPPQGGQNRDNRNQGGGRPGGGDNRGSHRR